MTDKTPTEASFRFADFIIKAANSTHYEEMHWIAETMTREDVAMLVRGCRTQAGAIKRAMDYSRDLTEYEDELKAASR